MKLRFKIIFTVVFVIFTTGLLGVGSLYLWGTVSDRIWNARFKVAYEKTEVILEELALKWQSAPLEEISHLDIKDSLGRKIVISQTEKELVLTSLGADPLDSADDIVLTAQESSISINVTTPNRRRLSFSVNAVDTTHCNP